MQHDAQQPARTNLYKGGQKKDSLNTNRIEIRQTNYLKNCTCKWRHPGYSLALPLNNKCSEQGYLSKAR